MPMPILILMLILMLMPIDNFEPEHNLYMILEAAYVFQDEKAFMKLVLKVVMLKPKLTDAIRELPEDVQNVLQSEYGRMIYHLTTQANVILQLLTQPMVFKAYEAWEFQGSCIYQITRDGSYECSLMSAELDQRGHVRAHPKWRPNDSKEDRGRSED
jgi:hypothetical protein